MAAPPAGAAADGSGAAEVAAGVEVAGGALSGLAAAAGPIGAALVVADVAAQQVADAFDQARERVELFGHQFSSAAGNDYLGMFKRQRHQRRSRLEGRLAH